MSTPSAVSPKNLSTCLLTHLPVPNAPSVAEAYAYVLAAEAVTPPMTRAGHRLYWVGGGATGSRTIEAGPHGFMVVGRHTACDAILGNDPSVALRHVLVTSTMLDDGCPLITILDLETADGFRLADGTPQRSISAIGPVVIFVGSHALIAIPSGEALPKVLPPLRPVAAMAAPPRLDFTLASLGQSSMSLGGHPYRSNPRESMVVTVHPSPIDVATRIDPHPAGALRGGASHEIAFVGRGGQSLVRLTSADLDYGVLVGRSPRCLDVGMQRLLDDGVSRVHLLIRRTRYGIFAYDVASTQGIYIEDRRVATAMRQVRSLALVETGARLWIPTRSAPLLMSFRAVVR